MARILVVEDSADTARGLRRNLEVEGHHVYLASTGVTGLARARHAVPDLVILDLLLPRMDGRDVLAALRAEGFEMPVLVLTALDGEAAAVEGFRLGADDYVTKPFRLRELVARIGALLRRGHTTEPDGTPAGSDVLPPLRLGATVIDTRFGVVTRRGRLVSLRPKEAALLFALVRQRGRVVRRSELLHEVWGYAADAVSRTLDTHVKMLRRKIEPDPSAPRYLLTVRNSGYRLMP